MHTKCYFEILKGKYHSEDIGIAWSIILNCFLNKFCGRVVWINLAQDKYQWRTVMKTAMNIHVT
jgi:hypothetical protein